MTKVIFDISMSLDGFVTASNVRPEEPMGDGGQRLHEWAFGEDERNRELLAEAVDAVGAVIAGRRTYDISVPWWGADGPTGPARVPMFVVSNSEPEEVPEGECTLSSMASSAPSSRRRQPPGTRTSP
jgi:dihydrofolate reductase